MATDRTSRAASPPVASPLSSEDAVNREVRGGTCRITLNRPRALNALSPSMMRDLTAAIRACASPDVRSVVLTGAGRAFSSGADLHAPSAGVDDPELIDAANECILALRTLPRPVVAAVNGPAVGVGASLAFACDLVYASDTSYFLLAFANIGLMPDGGASMLLPAAVGRVRAAEMALLGERVHPPEAERWGLVNGVLPSEDLHDHVADLADRLARGPTRAYAATKQALHHASLSLLEEQLALERQGQLELMRTEDHQAALEAFAQKQTPIFRNR